MSNELGCFIIDLAGPDLTAEERELLQHPLVGGVILFTRNYVSRVQLKNLCQGIRSARNAPCLIIADQEGGRVQRFKEEFTLLPPMSYFGECYDRDPSQALMSAKACARVMALELLACGVDLSLAPVLDLNKGVSQVIGTRAFHHAPKVVGKLAQAFIDGMREAGMAATGKHFPGHGSVLLDSHHALPIDERSFEEIKRDDMSVFSTLIQLNVPALMVAHLVFPAIDHLPVTFSRYWLQDVLRQQLGFSGVIFSDDLNMVGAHVVGDPVDRFYAARKAGCDVILHCNDRNGAIQVLDQIPYRDHLLDYSKWAILQTGVINNENN